MEKVGSSGSDARQHQRGAFGAKGPVQGSELKRNADREEDNFNPVIAIAFWGGLLLILFLIPGTRSFAVIAAFVALTIFVRFKLLDHERRVTLLGHPAVPWITYAILTIPGPYVTGAVGESGLLTSAWRWNAFLWFLGLMAYFSPPAGWYKAGPGYWKTQDFWSQYRAARSVRRTGNESDGPTD